MHATITTSTVTSTDTITSANETTSTTSMDEVPLSRPVATKLRLKLRYLPSPATSVHSECLFSGAGEVYDDKRSRLMQELAESLLLIKYDFGLVGKYI